MAKRQNTDAGRESKTLYNWYDVKRGPSTKGENDYLDVGGSMVVKAVGGGDLGFGDMNQALRV